MNFKPVLIGIVMVLLISSTSAYQTGTISGTVSRGYFEQPDQLKVTITPEVKDWLAEYAGKDNCFATTGIWYKDLEGNWRYGSTGSVMSMFYVAHLVGKEDTDITWEYSYNDLKALNNDVDFKLYDVKWVFQNQYCTNP